MTQPIQPWASLTNYPAGGNAWNGHATKIAPAAMYCTPNIPIPAQVLNWLFNRQDTSIGQLAAASWIAAVANWNPIDINVGNNLQGTIVWCAAWDPFYTEWIIGVQVGVVPKMYFTYDGGKIWSELLPGSLNPTNSYVPLAMVPSPVDGTMAVIRASASASAGEITSFTGGSGPRTSTDTPQAWLAPGGAPANQGVGFFFDSAFGFIGGTGFGGSSFVGVFGDSASASGTWTDAHTTLPVAWQSGTNHILQYLFAQNTTSTLAVVAMCGVTAGTDTSRLMTLSSTSAPADVTPSVLGGTTKQIRGVAFSDIDQLWGLMVEDASHNSYLYTSPDLATWTLVHTFTGFDSAGLATLGGVWAGLIYENTLNPGLVRVLFSADVGANGASSHWAFADYADLGPLQTGSAFLSSGNQLLRAELLTISPAGGVVACSLKSGFTFTAAIGPGGGGGGGSGISFSVNGVPIANNPHTAFDVVQSGASGTDVGGGLARANLTSGGTLARADVNHGSSPLNLTAQQRAFADVSAGILTVNAPAAPADGAEIAAKNSAGDASVNNITVSGNGHNIEDPYNPGTFAASITLRTKGMAVNWQFSSTTNTWEVV